MFQVRIHGRGGQGVVTAAEILSIAAFEEGRHSQAFPSFGSERMGAPVVAFCRMDDREIRLREPVFSPDALIVQDPTLLHQVNVFDGLPPEGYLLLNSSRPPFELGIAEVLGKLQPERVAALPATEIALQHIGRATPNTCLLAGFVALTGQLRLGSVFAAIQQKFKVKVADANIKAAQAAFDIVDAAMRQVAPHA